MSIPFPLAAAVLMSAAATAAPAYPPTETVAQTDVQHGVAVADPYRWLENDVRTDPRVAAWVVAQNAATDAFLRPCPGATPSAPG